MKLITKVAGLVVMLLAISLVLTLLGSINLNRVGDKLNNIANADIPLLSSMTNITFSQLERSALIERALLSAGSDDWDGFETADTKIASLEVQAENEFSTSFDILNAFLNESDDVDNEKYESLLMKLSSLQNEYQEFISESREILGLILNKEIAYKDVDLPSMRTKVEDMSTALLVLTAEISTTTRGMAIVANNEKESATEMMLLVSIIALVLTVILCGWIIHSINNQLGSDPSVLVGIADAMANGDLKIERNTVTHGVYGSINKTISKLIEIIGGIKTGATQVHEAAEQVSQGNANLSQRTQEQASSLEEVASSMEEMTGTITQNAENAQLTNQLTQEARSQAEKGVGIANNAVTAMNEIESSSKQISDIISVIDEIAFQTNLLALNAAVEAARAGEQGRGFAVVASEVRNLAGRSATAAKEIKDLIHDSVAKVEDGTKLVDETGSALADIVVSVKKASVMATEIAAASKEQSDGIEQVNKALLQMDEMTQQNASLVEEAAAASEAMGAQAEELTDLVAFFNVGTEQKKIVVGEVQRLAAESNNDPMPTQQSNKPLPAASRKVDADDSEWEDF